MMGPTTSAMAAALMNRVASLFASPCLVPLFHAVPQLVRKSRFSGVARAKRRARKLRNLRG